MGFASSTPFAVSSSTVAVTSSHVRVELVRLRAVGGVHGDLRGRHLEDEPAAAGVDVRATEHVPDEGPVILWLEGGVLI